MYIMGSTSLKSIELSNGCNKLSNNGEFLKENITLNVATSDFNWLNGNNFIFSEAELNSWLSETRAASIVYMQLSPS